MNNKILLLGTMLLLFMPLTSAHIFNESFESGVLSYDENSAGITGTLKLGNYGLEINSTSNTPYLYAVNVTFDQQNFENDAPINYSFYVGMIPKTTNNYLQVKITNTTNFNTICSQFGLTTDTSNNHKYNYKLNSTVGNTFSDTAQWENDKLYPVNIVVANGVTSLYFNGTYIDNATTSCSGIKPNVFAAEVHSNSGANSGYFDNFSIEELRYDITLQGKNNLTDESINNFTINIYENGSFLQTNTTTSGSVVFQPNSVNNFTFFFSADGFTSLNNVTLEFLNNSYLKETFEVLPAPRINISFYDEQTNELMNNENVTFEIINTDTNTGNNYSTNNGTSGVLEISAGKVVISYDSKDYSLRRSYITLENKEFSNLRLYLLNESAKNEASVEVIVTDINGIELEGAIVKLQKRFVEDEVVVYRTVSSEKTSSDGTTTFNLQKSVTTYRFVVEYLGETVKVTDERVIFPDTTTISIAVDLGTPVIDNTQETVGIFADITYNESTSIYEFVFNNPIGLSNEYCLKIEKIMGSGFTTLNSSCITTSGGSISLYATNSTGNYLATGTVLLGEVTRVIADLGNNLSNIAANIGNEGLFWAVLLFIVGAVVGAILAGIGGMVVGAMITFLLSSIFGLIQASWALNIIVIALGVISLIGMRRGT